MPYVQNRKDYERKAERYPSAKETASRFEPGLTLCFTAR